jgi:hypothetical protein
MNVLFTNDELKCKCGCGSLKLADGFANKLEDLRIKFGKPMIVNSCCRCDNNNIMAGGAKGSYHRITNEISQGTCAVDIKRQGYEYDAELISLALNEGWSLGLAKTFIHLDRRSDYGQPNVIYIY